jgi:type IV secretory pathway VirB3-like protein
MVPTYRPVYKALHRPLTLWGVDRRLFFLALLVGVVAFNLFYSFLAGCLLFAALYTCARWSTIHDPQFLPIVLGSAQTRRRYDAGKHDPFHIDCEGAAWSR